MAKKVNKECTKCKHYNGKDCTHYLNIGVAIKYRQENEFYIKPPKELNKEGDCKNYARA